MDTETLRKQLQIDRGLAVRLGREAVSIAKSGHYAAPSGTRVEIDRDLTRAAGGTVSYPPGTEPAAAAPRRAATSVEVVNETTLSAALRLLAAGMDVAALNMASAESPGGGFLHGARAQEEYLCRSSALFACLNGNAMYEYHRHRKDPFYSDTVLFSPQVPVFRDDDSRLLESPYLVSFLTSPAVMANAVGTGSAARVREIAVTMASRIDKLLAVAAAHRVTGLVLGAWGCGAFGNDGRVIAGLFRDSLRSRFSRVFDRVVFAVTDWSDDERFIGPFRRAFTP